MIINPAIFYWVDVIAKLSVASKGICFTGFLITVVVRILIAGIDDDDTLAQVKKVSRVCLYIGMVCGLMHLFLPDRTTMYQMMVAKYATYENAELTVEGIKSAVDYIVSKIGELQ